MPFTNKAIDDVLAIAATQEITGEPLVRATVTALAALVDASYVSVFELEPATRRNFDIGGWGDDDGVVHDAEEANELFWQMWDSSWCSWTEPSSPWFGRIPADQPVDGDRLYPTLRGAREAAMRHPYSRLFDPGHEVVIPLEAAPGRARRVLIARPWSDRPFSDSELLMMRLVQPHLDRAVARALVGVPAKELLSPRELEILAYLRGGSSTKDVAAALWVAPSTVRKHLENAYVKLGVHGRTEALARVYGHPGQAQAG
jgi:DNA-binding CsgD family transcriptional regulator